MGFGGYEPPQQPDTVQMVVPHDLVQAVGEFISDPDAFVAAVQQPAPLALVDLGNDTWVNPARVVAVVGDWHDTAVHVDGVPHAFVVKDATVEQVFESLQRGLVGPPA